jgi:hypothetical protein
VGDAKTIKHIPPPILASYKKDHAVVAHPKYKCWCVTPPPPPSACIARGLCSLTPPVRTNHLRNIVIMIRTLT